MGRNSKHTLAFTRPRRSGRHGGSQATLVLGDRTFRVPAAAVETPGKMIKHSSAMGAGGSVSPGAARVDGNHRGRDAEFFPTHAVMRFGIVRPVPEEPVNRQATNGLSDRRNKVWCIVARAVAHLQGGD